MESSPFSGLLSPEDSRQLFQRAKDWYFGGYLKMDTEKAPDPVHLVTFLRVLGFRVSKKEPPLTDNPPRKNVFRIEIDCGNPPTNVKMEFPEKTSETIPSVRDNDGVSPVSHEIPSGKLKVVKEVFEMLMEFLMEQDEATKNKDKVLAQQHWRRCMSLSTLGSPTPRFCLPKKKTDEMRNNEPPSKETAIKTVVLDMEKEYSSKGLDPSSTSNEMWALDAKQEEAMEVDVPVLSGSTLTNSNLSPIGLARQRTWVLETLESEDKKEFDKARTSTPTKPHTTAKIGLNAAHGLSKILRSRQVRTEVQPQRLRSANTESVKSMTQMRNAKEMSSRTSNKSKISFESSTSSVSSHSSVDATRSNVFPKTSSKFLMPPRTALPVSGGAKPKQPAHRGVSFQSSASSGLNGPDGTPTRSRRLVNLPQMKKDVASCTTRVQKKEEQPFSSNQQPSLGKSMSNEPEKLKADGDKLVVKRRTSLLPRIQLKKAYCREIPKASGNM